MNRGLTYNLCLPFSGLRYRTCPARSAGAGFFVSGCAWITRNASTVDCSLDPPSEDTMTERKHGSDMPDADKNPTTERVQVGDSSVPEKGTPTDIVRETEDVLERSDEGRDKEAIDTERTGNA